MGDWAGEQAAAHGSTSAFVSGGRNPDTQFLTFFYLKVGTLPCQIT